MSVEFVSEPFLLCWPELDPLTRKEYAEMYPDGFSGIPLDVSVDMLAALDAAGRLKTFTARVNGVLVGYALVVSTPGTITHKDLNCAQCIALWLAPEHRRGRTGVQFITYVDRVIRDSGAQYVTFAVLPNSKSAAKVLQFLGYHLGEEIYAKVF